MLVITRRPPDFLHYVVVEDRYGIRITEIITPSERVQKLNR